MNTLLTGFGPFGEVVNNPTERLVRYFGERGVPGHTLTTCLLPVSYKRAPTLLIEAIERGDSQGRPFDLVWMMGVASNSAYWRVERYGRNTNSRDRDADNVSPPLQIEVGGPEAIEVTVPVGRLVAALSQTGIPAAVSESAGAYLCNHALYTALRHIQRSSLPARAGFLHVPADTETLAGAVSAMSNFTFLQHIKAVEITFSALADPD